MTPILTQGVAVAAPLDSLPTSGALLTALSKRTVLETAASPRDWPVFV
jgi:hypothetical protein